MSWTASDVPDLRGRTYVVTGASSGLGEATTVGLAARGAHVVLATRSARKTSGVIHGILRRNPTASLEHLELDLSDLASVEVAARTLTRRHRRIAAVVANAGIMAPPHTRTVDGFELQFGVNHLGHFAFLGRVLPVLLATGGGRVVVVSSINHRFGRLDLGDPNFERRPYRRWDAYAASKIANLLYVLELERRLETSGASTIAVAAHPGYTRTQLQFTGPTAQGGIGGRAMGALSSMGNLLAGQPVAGGVLPQLYAATAPDVTGGSYWGPGGVGELRGSPVPVSRSGHARDPELATELWEVSERLTGVSYAFT